MRVRSKKARPRTKRCGGHALPRGRFECLEPRLVLSGLPYGAVAQDTAEYMLGDIVATVVFFESDGSIDPSTKDWNQLVRDQYGNPVLDGNGDTISAGGPNYIELTKDRVEQGLQWWEDTLANFYTLNYTNVSPVHSLNFILDFQYAHNPVRTGYEPIDRISNDYTLWVPDFLRAAGYYNTGVIDTDVRAFNNAQRLKYDADWAFTIFVANDYGDTDLRFKDGGSFTQAFAFSGGRFLVAPSQRPASTFAHETGHIFYALDEYYGAGSYLSRRGYYNTQNLNSWDNPDPNYVDQPSIMYNGQLLQTAWANHTSSVTSLAMVGWRDSDADGVFDVLDVPLSLTGTGSYDPATHLYRFTGVSEAGTLPNLNSAGRRNDITINEVSRAVYSLDGGATWIAGATYDAYQSEVTLNVAMQPGQEILIRTESVDPLTGKVVTASDSTFWGTTDYPTALTESGIEGYVWYDKDGDHIWDATERGVAGWTIQLVDGTGQPLQLLKDLEPDDYAQYQELGSALSGVTLTATGYDVNDARVGAVESAPASTGTKVLGAVRLGSGTVWVTDWTAESRNLRIDLAAPTTTISIDAVGPATGGYGRLEIYGAGGTLLGRYTTAFLQAGVVETMTLSVPTAQITYALVRSTTDSTIRLDHLRVGPASSATTDASGAYALKHLPPGSYHVQALPSSDWVVTEPVSAVRDVVVDAQGNMVWDTDATRPSDFAGQPSPTAPPWRNPMNALDVNDDGQLTPIDALQVINELNRNGSHALVPPSSGSAPPPYLDVTGDSYVTPVDALRVINELNRQTSGNGEGTSGAGESGAGGSDEGGGESEGVVASGRQTHRAADGDPSATASVDVFNGGADAPLVGQESPAAGLWSSEETLALLAQDVARARRKPTDLDAEQLLADAWARSDVATLPDIARSRRRLRLQ
jgi:hypothetical protein